MRLWAEEHKGKTLELLLTYPISVSEIMFGKFLAAFAFFLVTLSGTFSIPFLLNQLGSPDTGPIQTALLTRFRLQRGPRQTRWSVLQ